MNRRQFLGLLGTSLSGISLLAKRPVFADSGAVSGSPPAQASDTAAADFSLRIAPLKLEPSPGHVITTVGYNGTVPGPLLRVKEGQNVTIAVHNDSDIAELVH